MLIDIRSERQRERDGAQVPISSPATCLEWRLDPASGYSDPALSDDLGRHVILVCNEGYESSLAAATLQDLGFCRATDLTGGFQAWRAAGCSVETCPRFISLSGWHGRRPPAHCCLRDLRGRGRVPSPPQVVR